MPEMDVASATETIIFFVFATITILGALGLIYAQRVAHSMLSLFSVSWPFQESSSSWVLNSRSDSDSGLLGQCRIGGVVRYHADSSPNSGGGF